MGIFPPSSGGKKRNIYIYIHRKTLTQQKHNSGMGPPRVKPLGGMTSEKYSLSLLLGGNHYGDLEYHYCGQVPIYTQKEKDPPVPTIRRPYCINCSLYSVRVGIDVQTKDNSMLKSVALLEFPWKLNLVNFLFLIFGPPSSCLPHVGFKKMTHTRTQSFYQ